MNDNVAKIDVETQDAVGDTVRHERLFVRFPEWCRVCDMDGDFEIICLRLNLDAQVCMSKRDLIGENGVMIAAAHADRLAKSINAQLKGSVQIERVDMDPPEATPIEIAGGHDEVH